ncbi:MAG: 6,7-dimethyl-8-ribityllumazine synthase [Chitinophagaceae bacterium]|nr:6,7-dimethyl-8-ribityllumazine synthase [Chitinophagaceae bacterium]
MASSNDHSTLLEYNNLRISSSQVVLIYTEWNEEIIQSLRDGVKKVLTNFPQIQIQEICVPGAIEIPYAIAQYQAIKGAEAYIALGCVIRGETPHFDYVCQSVTQGISQLNITLPSPVIFGILTVNDVDQAWDRLGGKHGHKGEEAGIAALKMMSFKENLKSNS